jgi:hypothetical protein
VQTHASHATEVLAQALLPGEHPDLAVAGARWAGGRDVVGIIGGAQLEKTVSARVWKRRRGGHEEGLSLRLTFRGTTGLRRQKRR